MNNVSLFNLIEIFSRPRRSNVKLIDPVEHCEVNQHHDYYCDVERTHAHLNN